MLTNNFKMLIKGLKNVCINLFLFLMIFYVTFNNKKF